MEHDTQKLRNRLFRLALALVREPGEAEDLVQEVFVEFVQRERRGEPPPRHLEAWMRRVLQRLAWKQRRRADRLTALEEQAARYQALLDREGAEAGAALLSTIGAALEELSEEDRRSLEDRHARGLSHRQVAERDGISEDAARKRYSRALARLREIWREEPDAASLGQPWPAPRDEAAAAGEPAASGEYWSTFLVPAERAEPERSWLTLTATDERGAPLSHPVVEFGSMSEMLLHTLSPHPTGPMQSCRRSRGDDRGRIELEVPAHGISWVRLRGENPSGTHAGWLLDLPPGEHGEVRLARAASIRLEIRSEGTSLPGARVRAYHLIGDERRTVTAAEAESDAAGRLAIEGLAPGMYLLLLRGPGGELERRLLELQPGEDWRGSWSAHAGLRIHGIVQTPDGRPVAAAAVWSGRSPSRTDERVHVLNADEFVGTGLGRAFAVRSDEEGRFVLPVPRSPENGWLLFAEHEELGSGRARCAPPSLDAELRAVITLSPATRLRGRCHVWDREPVPEDRMVVLDWDPQGSGGMVRLAELEKDGSFCVSGLRARSAYTLGLLRDGCLRRLAEVRRADGEHDRVVDVGVLVPPAPARVSGEIRSDSGEPLGGRRLAITPRSFHPPGSLDMHRFERYVFTRQLLSDAEGRFRFEELDPGEWTLSPMSSGVSRTVHVQAGQDVGGVLVVEGSASLSGKIVGPDGEPVARARVAAIDREGVVLGELMSDRSGGFGFQHLPRGPLRLEFSPQPTGRTGLDVDTRPLAPKSLEVTAPATVEVSLETGIPLEGVLLDLEERPLARILLSARPEAGGPPAYAWTDAAGRFRLVLGSRGAHRLWSGMGAAATVLARGVRPGRRPLVLVHP